MTPRRVKTAVVALVAAHSIILGLAMLFYPRETMRICGWDYDGPTFFPSQSGVFLLLLGMAYAIGARQRQFARFLVASKAVAVAFLLSHIISGTAPPAALLAAIADGLMGITVAAVLVWEAVSQRTAPDPAIVTSVVDALKDLSNLLDPTNREFIPNLMSDSEDT